MSSTDSFNYETLVDFFGAKTIVNRTNILYQKMDAFIRDSGLGDNVYISEPLLRRAVIDYFTDIYRLRMFHDIAAVNRHKIVAYTVFWVLRRQPIQLRETAGDTEDFAFVNENFAATLIAYACVTPSSSPELMYESCIDLNEQSQKVYMRFLFDLKYHLRYRLVDARNLELMLSAYETGFILGESHPSKTPIQMPTQKETMPPNAKYRHNRT